MSLTALDRERYFVLSAGILSLVLLLGIARFAFTPLIPIMQANSILNDLSAGWQAAINYAGYMCGAMIAASISNLMLKDTLFRAGLIVAVISTLGMGVAENQILWAIMRFLAGLSSAAGLLIGSGLVLNWLIRNGFRSELGLHFSGVGLGIIVTAIVVELIAQQLTWQEQWWFLGVLGALIAIPSWRWLPRPHNGTFSTSGKALEDTPPSRRFITLMLCSYFCAGFGYVIGATFTVAIVERQPGLEGRGELVWLVVGLMAMPAVIVWDKVARKTGTLAALLINYLLHIVSIMIPIFFSSLSALLLSAVLYGCTFIGIVGLVLTMAGRFYPTKPAKLMGKLTLSYCVAQIVAPAAAGIMAEQSGHYSGALIMAAGMMVIGTLFLVALMLTEQTAVRALEPR